MKETALIALPLVLAGLALLWRSERTRPWLLPVGAVVHLALAFSLTFEQDRGMVNAWFGFDSLSRAVVPMVSLLFLVCAIYAVSYLRIRLERKNRLFVAALLAVVGLLSLAFMARNLGVLWVAAEAATLLTGPLLHFNGSARSFEATWKYLLICGTGVAFALFGSFCLGYASLLGGGGGDLNFDALATCGPSLSRPWLLAAWVLLLAGYGTKMGLVPLHSWKPDVYGEAPGLVGAILAGGMTTMAFTAILRVKHVVDAAGDEAMTNRTLLVFGLLSMLVASLFLLASRDFKRMLAYSSIEQMGILAVGATLGVAGLAATLFHVWNNGLTKGALFLSAGNMRRAAGGARTRDDVAGMAWLTPVSARIFVAGIFAITAFPPFGLFFSELRIVRAALETGRPMVAAIFLGCLLLAFCGLTRLAFAIVDGRPRAASKQVEGRLGETPWLIAPALIFLAFSLWLGVAAPAQLGNAWAAAASNLLKLR